MKDIKGYEGVYQIDTSGNVYALPRIVIGGRNLKGKFLKPDINNVGYFRVRLSNNGTSQRFSIHRLVAENFVSNPYNKPCVNHKDGNKQNNHYSNLEWVTVAENTQHSWDNGFQSRKYTPRIDLGNTKTTPVKAINIETGKSIIFDSQMEASRMLKLSHGNIWMCMNGVRHTSGSYRFEKVI